MIFAEPSRTNWDLNFNLLGFPVRVHPMFFIMPVLLSGGFLGGFEGNTGFGLLVIVGVFFLSILVHELGHALAFRHYGYDCHIVLYLMGGLAVPDSGVWRGARRQTLTPPRQIVVSFAGPLFGFLLAAMLMGIVLLMGGKLEVGWLGAIPIPLAKLNNTAVASSPETQLLFAIGLYINVFWSLLNLVPVYPLDGGQISRQLFLIKDPWDGARKSVIVSIVAAGLVCLWAFTREDTFMGIMFLYLGINNFTFLQQMGGGGQRW